MWDLKGKHKLSNSLSEALLYFSCGFLLFLSCEHSIMRRVVTLLNQVAVTLEDNTGLQAQMDSAVKAAKQCQDDNLLLKQVSPNQSLMTGLKLYFSSFSLNEKVPFLPQCVPSTVVYCVPSV